MQNTSISGRLIVYSQPEVNQLEPRCCVLMKMLSPHHYIADTLIILWGRIIQGDIFITRLIVLHFPGNANMAKVSMVVEQRERITPECLS